MRFSVPNLLTDDLEELRNFNKDHVPIGIHWDLQDQVDDTFPACDWLFTPGSTRCGPIDDQVSGLTTAQLFHILTSDVSDPWLYQDKLKAVFNLNSQDVDNLFEDYLSTQ